MMDLTMRKVNPPYDTPCFAAFCACGGWMAVSVDTSACTASNAKLVSEWLRAGYRIEKVSVHAVRDKLRMCKCGRRKKKRQKELF